MPAFEMNHAREWIDVALLLALLLAAAWSDVRHRRIPNGIVVAGIAAALLISAAPDGRGIPAALAGLGIGLAALMPFYIAGATGAGDVKLLGMVGSFLGLRDTVGAVIFTLFAGAVLAMIVTLRQRALRAVGSNLRSIFHDALYAGIGPRQFDARRDTAANLPYALAIAAGTMAWLLARHSI